MRLKFWFYPALLVAWLFSMATGKTEGPLLPPNITEVIYTSAPQAVDYPDMLSRFSEPRYQWSRLLEHVTTIKHYETQTWDTPHESTGSITYSLLMSLGAFRKVRESRQLGGLGLQQSIEMNALKEHNCNNRTSATLGRLTDQSANAPLQIYRAGGNVSSLVIDSAMRGGMECRYELMTPDKAAVWTAAWIVDVRKKVSLRLAELQRLHPDIPVVPLTIGDIEPYPAFPVANHRFYITKLNDELRKAGEPPLAFYHIDTDFSAISDFGKMGQDVRELCAFVRERGMKCGLIVNGEDSRSLQTDTALHYLTTANHKLTTFKNLDLFSVIDHLIIQSWAADSRGGKWMPPNVPDTDRQTHTAFALHAIECIGGKTQCAPYP